MFKVNKDNEANAIMINLGCPTSIKNNSVTSWKLRYNRVPIEFSLLILKAGHGKLDGSKGQYGKVWVNKEKGESTPCFPNEPSTSGNNSLDFEITNLLIKLLSKPLPCSEQDPQKEVYTCKRSNSIPTSFYPTPLPKDMLKGLKNHAIEHTLPIMPQFDPIKVRECWQLIMKNLPKKDPNLQSNPQLPKPFPTFLVIINVPVTIKILINHFRNSVQSCKRSPDSDFGSVNAIKSEFGQPISIQMHPH